MDRRIAEYDRRNQVRIRNIGKGPELDRCADAALSSSKAAANKSDAAASHD
jgi:hypothetical protein